MAYFNKIGLLLLDRARKKFLVCEKDNFTSDYILPGGQIENNESDIECLIREMREELAAELDIDTLKFIGEYLDVAAGDHTKDVSIKLYEGKINGEPKPSQEIIGFKWISKDDLLNPRLSPIIKNKILPDLISKNILQ